VKEKTVEQIANQRQSGKTYLAMDEETKLKIEALYACYNLNSRQIGDIVDWPWQSCSKHIKVMNDRIEYGKTTFDELEAKGEQTITKYGLDLYVNGIPEAPKETPAVEPKPTPINSRTQVAFDVTKEDEEFLKEYSTPFPEDPVEQADPEHDRRVRKDAPFYLTLQNIIDRYEAGDIVFKAMSLHETNGVLYIEYASA
jgi:hypothetical protein